MQFKVSGAVLNHIKLIWKLGESGEWENQQSVHVYIEVCGYNELDL